MSSKIRVLDISKIGLDRSEDAISASDWREVGADLRESFTGSGFAYLVGHGLPSKVRREAFGVSRRFFEELTTEEKQKAFPRDPITTQGYVPVSHEKLDRLKLEDGEPALHEFKESMDVNRMYAHSPFPDSAMPEVRTAFGGLAGGLKPLARRILRAMALSLGLEGDFFEKRHRNIIADGSGSKLRALYYPAIKGPIIPGTVRCGEHADYGTITLLLQDAIGGLEVKSVGEGWIQATPLEDSIVINVGEQMDMITGGTFPATRHRVVVPEEEARRRTSRQSFAFFVHADDQVMLETVVGKKDASVKPVTARQHLDMRFAETYDDYKTNGNGKS